MSKTNESEKSNETEIEPAEHVHGPGCNHHHEALKPVTRKAPKVGRNDPCSCGSKKKFKKCCGS